MTAQTHTPRILSRWDAVSMGRLHARRRRLRGGERGAVGDPDHEVLGRRRCGAGVRPVRGHARAGADRTGRSAGHRGARHRLPHRSRAADRLGRGTRPRARRRRRGGRDRRHVSAPVTWNVLHGRMFSKTNTRLVGTAGIVTFLGVAAAPFFAIWARTARSPGSRTARSTTWSSPPTWLQLLTVGFLGALAVTTFTVGDRLQRDTEGLV